MAAASIAKSVLYAAKGRARRRKVTVSLDAPRKLRGGGVGCLVKFTGVARPHNVIGEDSMQALALAMTYVQLRVRVVLDAGWRFYFSSGATEPTDLLQIWFPHQAMPRWRSNTSLERRRGR
jgi:hypothetical protein